MRNPDGLYKLIRSLKSNERAGFIETGAKDPEKCRFMKLFEAIDRTKEEINDVTMMRKLNYPNKNTFYVAKNHLFGLILRSICVKQIETGIENSVQNKLFFIKILYEKTLFNKACELLKKLKKVCVETENFVRLLEVLKWERNLIIEGAIKGNKIKLLEQICAEEETVLKSISNYSSYRLLSFSFNSFVKEATGKRNKDFASGLKYYKTHPLIRDERKAITLASRITLLDVSASIYRMLNKTEKVYSLRKKMINLIDSNPVFRNENLTNYVISLYNLANTGFELGHIEETTECIAKLRSLAEKYSRKLSTNTKMLLEIGLSRLEIEKNFSAGEFHLASENSILLADLVKKYESALTENEKADSLSLSIKGLFLHRQFSDCLKILNFVLGFNAENIDQKTLIFVRFIQIMILIEKGSYETAEYRSISLLRYLKKVESSSRSFNRSFKLIKLSLNGIRKASKEPEFTKVIEVLLSKYKVENDETGMSSLFENWIKARSQL